MFVDYATKVGLETLRKSKLIKTIREELALFVGDIAKFDRVIDSRNNCDDSRNLASALNYLSHLKGFVPTRVTSNHKRTRMLLSFSQDKLL